MRKRIELRLLVYLQRRHPQLVLGGRGHLVRDAKYVVVDRCDHVMLKDSWEVQIAGCQGRIDYSILENGQDNVFRGSQFPLVFQDTDAKT